MLGQLMPVPRDLQLPLPLPETALAVLLVLSFLLHIFFVNLTVGSSLLTTIFEWKGWKSGDARWDKLAKALAETITVNKSVAVVLGVGPLLCINLLYTIQFYSANTLTGHAWVLIIPMVIAAFLLAYLHKYTWENWSEGNNKTLHLIIGTAAATIFLMIPFIFLSNINLMLFPDKWDEVRGFFSSLLIGNVFPRYFHFLCASIALTGLFIAGWLGRKSFPLTKLISFSHSDLIRLGYQIAFYATLAQFFFGPLLLFTLPAVGLSDHLYRIILSGAALGLVVLLILRHQIKQPALKLGGNYVLICLLFSIVVLAMGTGRHLYRETAVAEHRMLIKERTVAYQAALEDFNQKLASGAITLPMTGERVFRNCASCHAVDKVLVGPSLVEIANIYKNNPDGIVKWAMNPGKKRAGFQQMPSFSHLPPEQLKMVADYMLMMGASKP
jgi:cytochrome c